MWPWGEIHHIKQLQIVLLIYMTSYAGENGAVREELFECEKGYSSHGKAGKKTRKWNNIIIISLS